MMQDRADRMFKQSCNYVKAYFIEEATKGKTFRHIGDMSPSKFIHNSPAQRKD